MLSIKVSLTLLLIVIAVGLVTDLLQLVHLRLLEGGGGFLQRRIRGAAVVFR